MMATKADYEATELGVFSPFPQAVDSLHAGQVGFIAASIKSVEDAKIGDTITTFRKGAEDPLPGFKEVKPMVFCGIFPTDSSEYPNLRDALEKLQLNDSALTYEPETSDALGFGFRCGFLGMLHMEIVQERLEREYDLDLITTAPSVVYHVYTAKDDAPREVENPSRLPDPGTIDRIEEPYFEVNIHVPAEFVGSVIRLCEERRGEQKGIQYASTDRVIVTYLLPLAEVLFDFYDRLKTADQGLRVDGLRAPGYRANKLVRVDMLINGTRSTR
jgi:GTP-binding protein LepA